MTVTENEAAEAEAAEALSTAPTERAAPQRRTPTVWLRLGWRRLTSMRTALQLLFLLSLAAVPGGLLPQRGQELARVNTYLATHPTLGPILDRLSLFDVFKAPWFAAIYLLLFVSLIGCLFPRIKLHVKALRNPPPKTPARLAKLPGGYATFTTAAAPENVLAQARPLLKGWRVRDNDGSLSAERGYSRETGNLVFHVALVLLLAGVAVGSLFGYEGDRVLVDGPTLTTSTAFTNTHLQYDQYRPGALVSDGSLPAWQLQLNQFVATYRADNSPADYNAYSTFTNAAGKVEKVDIKVNHPLQAAPGTKVYLLNHGYAPVFQLSKGGQVVQTSDPVICAPVEATDLLSTCHVSFGGLPHDPTTNATQDLAFDVTFAPTGEQSGSTFFSASPKLLNPVAVVTPYVGALGDPSDVDNLDYRYLKQTGQVKALLIADKTTKPDMAELSGLPGGYTLSVSTVQQWASFQVKHDPGKKIVLLAAIGIVGGLLLSLRVRRRRLWVRARRTGDGGSAGTVVEVGGLARSDPDTCRAELERIAAELEASVGETGAQ